MTGAGNPREIELKLEAEPGSIDLLKAHPLIHAGRARTEQLKAVYFDTDDLALRAAGVSLRIRSSDGASVQTIKAARGPGRSPGRLVLDRSEWDHPVAAGALDFSVAKGTALEPLAADDAMRTAIRPRFTVEVERTAVIVERDGSSLELALDSGTVRVPSGRREARAAPGGGERHPAEAGPLVEAPLAEVELELKHGDPAALFRVAASLAETTPLRLSFKSKSERGYELLTGARPKPAKAEPLRIPPALTSGAAFQAIARSCLRQYVGNEAVLRVAKDPDAVHQMRVALRRLRAAVTLFKDALADGERDAVRGDLKALASALGPARDLDVFIDKTLRPAEARHAGDPDFAALMTDYERRRDEAYARALAALRSGEFARAILRAAAWIEAGDWLGSRDKTLRAARDRPIAAHAAAELDRRWRKVRRRSRGLRRLAPEARHEVRIEIKKLRYAAEFFASLFEEAGGVKRRKTALATLATLQETLGDLNDIAVGEEEAATGALAALQSEQAARVGPLLAEARNAVRRFRDLEPFWRG